MKPRQHSHLYIILSNGCSIFDLSSTGIVAIKKSVFKYTDANTTIATLTERLKVNIDLMYLFIVIFRLTIILSSK